MDILTGVFFFAFGYFYNEYVSQKERDTLRASLLQECYQTFENTSYIILSELTQMHDYGLKALELVSQKCSENDVDKQDEYTKIAEVFERKMNEFGDGYMKILRQHVPYKLKFNTFKDVKENFNNLINNKSEDNKNA